MRIPAAVAFGSGHEVGERNKIELVSVADDENNNLLMLLPREEQEISLRCRQEETTKDSR